MGSGVSSDRLSKLAVAAAPSPGALSRCRLRAYKFANRNEPNSEKLARSLAPRAKSDLLVYGSPLVASRVVRPFVKSCLLIGCHRGRSGVRSCRVAREGHLLPPKQGAIGLRPPRSDRSSSERAADSTAENLFDAQTGVEPADEAAGGKWARPASQQKHCADSPP